MQETIERVEDGFDWMWKGSGEKRNITANDGDDILKEKNKR